MAASKKKYLCRAQSVSKMENNSNSVEQEEKGRKGSGLVVVLFIVIALLAALSGYLFYQLNDLKSAAEKWETEKAESERIVEDFGNQLHDLTAKYDSLMKAHEGLQAELEVERAKVLRLLADYEILKRSGGDPLKGPGGQGLRQRMEELQDAYDETTSIIDELKAKNQELTDENFRASRKLEETTAQNEKLSQENSRLTKTVEIAKRLKAYEVYADAVRVSGTKEKQTGKAGKADRIRVCFTILDNQLADKQEKNIYASIKDPNGKILTDGDKSRITLMNGTETEYSIRKNIFYDNKVMDVCLNWDVKTSEKLVAGDYSVNLYCDGVVIGSADFTLK